MSLPSYFGAVGECCYGDCQSISMSSLTSSSNWLL
jgi:hypothetical protein